jgi:transcription initiation factor TFIIH subunit 1
MKEPEFWKKFCTAESYRQKEKIALGRAEASADRQLAIFLEDDDIVADEVHRKIGNVDPTIDMIADFSDDYTHLPGHGIFEYGSDDNVIVVIDKLQQALLHDINRHAIIVLEGRQGCAIGNN